MAARQLAEHASAGGIAAEDLLPSAEQQAESGRNAKRVIAVGIVLIVARVAVELV